MPAILIPHPFHVLTFLLLHTRCRTIQLLPVLLKSCNHLLPTGADQPLCEFLRRLCILHFVSHQEMCGVQKRVVRFVRRGFVDDRLAGEVTRKGEEGAAVVEGVFLEEDRGGEGLEREGDVLVIPGGVGGGPRHLDWDSG
jgi:hypothetical protein